ncbi:MerR family transcriptional regulator [Xylocopilactobacillus apis]|uniref:Transcriptional regulator n=1 Tax=Xylocopilactobacillus apis TaxID=2932183 RepID=A0AAU9CSZ4_9LACO|nr:MerR family transcriptional regulator [Xylocopilactobacillus apis]BDR55491.1 transcriptional regulator [Xylocopilactobacillus apis]
MQKEKTTYSISEAAQMLNVSPSTLRYYDQEGIIPDLHKNKSGIRKFTSQNIETLNLIGCLKCAGMSIKDIKVFMEWCNLGDSTLTKRLEMFQNLKNKTLAQMQELQNTLDTIEYKCDYYTQAVQDGTEKNVHHEHLNQNKKR